ncbi:MAG: sulfoxide reductase heme-binding subunit YedZ [Verrucomicrobiota bacterium]|nr:sulfoxide reductase heme-binding subunit YedZ [Verrucomicrobiota bacterium]
MQQGDIRFVKMLVLVNGLTPLALLVWDQSRHRLGANPQNFLILTTGMMTLIFLMLTMAVTPVRKVFGLNWLIQLRRMFGLFAFFYGCLHFLCFYSLDRAFSLSSTLHEIVARQYLWFGITALLAMVPLAITSTNGMIKRLGGKRWRALHRLAYVAAIAGAVHFFMQVKADVRLPLAFAALLAVLLGYRLLDWWRRSKRAPATAAAVKS